MNERAYYRYNGQWKYVYILEKFEQYDLEGGAQTFARIKLTKNSNQTMDVEYSRLEKERPYKRREFIG